MYLLIVISVIISTCLLSYQSLYEKNYCNQLEITTETILTNKMHNH